MFQGIRGPEILILLLIILLLFGAKRLPDAARGLGRSLRIFKAETKALTEDGGEADDASAVAAGATPAVEGSPAAAPAAPPAPPVGTPVNVTPPADQRPA